MMPNVQEERLYPCVLDTTSRHRNSEAATGPSLLLVHYERPERVSTTTSQMAEATAPMKPHVQRLLRETNEWNKKTEKHLSAYEWELCLKMRETMELAGNLTMRLQHNNTLPTEVFSNVWGVTKQTLNRKRKMVLENPMISTSRKK
jgi:hypothetical protein